jgi:hypothetical protein
VGLLYVYVRQQLKYQNDQLEQLMGMVKCMVVPQEIPRLEERKEERKEDRPCKVIVSDDEESDEESDEDSESDGTIETVEPAEVNAEVTEVNAEVTEEITELSTADMAFAEVKMDEMANMLNIIGLDISMVRPVDLESLSVKELRAKVAAVGGPTLKTKREMVQYLSR